MRKLILKNKGFTFMEVLAVIVILSILVMLAVPLITKYLNYSRSKSMIENSLSVISAVRNDAIENGYFEKTYTIKEINDILERDLKESPFLGKDAYYVGLDQGFVFDDSYTGSRIDVKKVLDDETGKYKYEFKMCLFDKAGRGFNLIDENKIKADGIDVIKMSGVNTCQKLATDKLIEELGNSGLEKNEIETDNTLQINPVDKLIEYRFQGGDDVVTNNYVYFNCSDIKNQTKDTCELYRIIGVLPTDDGNGNIENRVKLIKASSYGNEYWDRCGSNCGYNNWINASLKKEFNDVYYESINSQYRDLIGDAKYYLGGSSLANISVKTDVMYKQERKISGSEYYHSGNPNSWTGKIGLMYASDFGYAASKECSDSKFLSFYYENICAKNNWLYSGEEWLLAQQSGYDYVSLCVSNIGGVGFTATFGLPYDVRPVFYLEKDAEFVDGDGSVDNPYKLFD